MIIGFIKKFWFVFLILFTIISFFLIVEVLQSLKKEVDPETTITPSPVTTGKGGSGGKLYPLQKTIINITKESEIKNSPDILKVESLTNETRAYYLKSPVSLSRPNKIITEKGIVKYEQVITDESDPTSDRYATVSRYKVMLGEPNRVIKGSKYYGNYLNTYIYASKGVSLIGNPSTDEVFEIQSYSPTTVEKYIENYGSDIDLNPAPGGH